VRLRVAHRVSSSLREWVDRHVRFDGYVAMGRWEEEEHLDTTRRIRLLLARRFEVDGRDTCGKKPHAVGLASRVRFSYDNWVLAGSDDDRRVSPPESHALNTLRVGVNLRFGRKASRNR
jgi:hypothetical protein